MYEFSTILNTVFQPLHTHVSNIQNFWKITFFPRDNRCTGKNATSNTIGERERCSPSVSLYSCPTKVCRCGGQHRFFPKVISRNTTLRNDEEYLSIRDAHLIAFLHCSPKPLTLDRSAKILWRRKKKKKREQYSNVRNFSTKEDFACNFLSIRNCEEYCWPIKYLFEEIK